MKFYNRPSFITHPCLCWISLEPSYLLKYGKPNFQLIPSQAPILVARYLLEGHESSSKYDATSIGMLFHSFSRFQLELLALFPDMYVIIRKDVEEHERRDLCVVRCNNVDLFQFSTDRKTTSIERIGKYLFQFRFSVYYELYQCAFVLFKPPVFSHDA